jgi:imidazolonepropionase
VATIDSLWINSRLATMKQGTRYGAIEDGALAISEGVISWAGPESRLPSEIKQGARVIHDALGAWITPGLIDCHTHLVHGGHRAAEFEMRLHGATYEDIAASGGGILSTVKATRDSDRETLLRLAEPRLKALMNEGVTTVEIKSGYGLDLDTELRMLEVARELGNRYTVTVRTSFLGAHALPTEYAGKADDYIDFVCRAVMPEIKSRELADAVDAFCDTIGFTREQTRKVFETAKRLGLPVKLHAEQLSNQEGTALAAEFQALSADHLEYLSESGTKAMAAKGVTAVLLPGAFYFLREKRLPPVEMLRRHGVPMALSTDCNPGSSPITSIQLMLNMGCTLFGLTPEEALAGVTRNAASALGLSHRKGTLEPGKDADFILWDIDMPSELAYRIGFNPCRQIIFGGKPTRQSS